VCGSRSFVPMAICFQTMHRAAAIVRTVTARVAAQPHSLLARNMSSAAAAPAAEPVKSGEQQGHSRQPV
jgi:hypothetical protein